MKISGAEQNLKSPDDEWEEQKMAVSASDDESKWNPVRQAVGNAVVLWILDAFILASPTFAIVTLCALVFWMIPRALIASRKKDMFVIRAWIAVIYLVMVGASFSAFAVNNYVARTRATEVISAVNRFYSTHHRYPTYLNELVPKSIGAIPRAKYTLLFGRFHYDVFDGKPLLMYYGWSPFQRWYYHFVAKEWTVLD